MLSRWSQVARTLRHHVPRRCASQSTLILTSTDIYRNLAFESWIYLNRTFSDEERLLLLWRNEPCVVIGRHQNPWLEVNLEREDLVVARRESGGGTVYHDLGNLCLSFFTSRKTYDRGRNSQWLADTLNCYYECDVTVSCRDDLYLSEVHKISGSASKLGSKTAYHHCTLLVDVDKEALTDALNCQQFGAKSNATESIRSPVKNLQDVDTDVQMDDLIDILSQIYADKENLIQEIIPTEESFPGLNEIENKLKTHEWIWRKTPKFSIKRTFDNHDFGSIDVEFVVEKGKIRKAQITNGVNLANFLESCPFHLPDVETWLNDFPKHYDTGEFEKFLMKCVICCVTFK